MKRPFPMSLDRYAWTWNHCQHMALVAREQFAGHFHILRFEDMVASPEGALRPILDAMGLSWSDRCLSPSFNGIPLAEVAPWGTIVTPTTEANIATRQELTADEERRMATLTRVMVDLIYVDQGAVVEPVVAHV
jgi:hypothetical protein